MEIHKIKISGRNLADRTQQIVNIARSAVFIFQFICNNLFGNMIFSEFFWHKYDTPARFRYIQNLAAAAIKNNFRAVYSEIVIFVYQARPRGNFSGVGK